MRVDGTCVAGQPRPLQVTDGMGGVGEGGLQQWPEVIRPTARRRKRSSSSRGTPRTSRRFDDACDNAARAKLGLERATACHAEGHGLESHQPLSEESATAGFLAGSTGPAIDVVPEFRPKKATGLAIAYTSRQQLRHEAGGRRVKTRRPRAASLAVRKVP